MRLLFTKIEHGSQCLFQNRNSERLSFFNLCQLSLEYQFDKVTVEILNPCGSLLVPKQEIVSTI